MRQRYSFLLSPTWLGWLGVCAVFAVACWFLGQWQLDRREVAVEENNRVVANYDQDPVPYAEVQSLFNAGDPDHEWTVATLRGEYLEEDALLVRNRGHGGQVGFEQLVPFRDSDTGDVLVISRGWLPTASEGGGEPAFTPGPPAGSDVTVTVRLRPGEPAINRDAPEGQLASIDLQEYTAEVGYSLVPGSYGLMAEESPVQAETPFQMARPSLDEGPHLSYSMQWIAFGMLGFVGWGYAARVHARNRDMDALPNGASEAVSAGGTHIAQQDRLREAKRRRRAETGRYSDEDAEDAWVDERIGAQR